MTARPFKFGDKYREGVSVVAYHERFKSDFGRLNYEWIERYFVVEHHDRELLDQPYETIIEPGGEIFFAVAGGEAVGTAAMIPEGDERFELAKMAVSPDWQGRGIGDMLLETCVGFARERKALSIVLLSNTRLKAAIGLYRKHGFRETLTDSRSPYERVNIRMELAL
ncbi:MAG TPA: GNAT family N-acetyltransferase [Pyrinomonadaceae bacterium]|nr:GNAT family N-acetyltransferase [Pyrinomonadaceae bacterium]HMP66319.1 GNAT family N-acetyltransferase [Pyrinomonadaceae bacterium]